MSCYALVPRRLRGPIRVYPAIKRAGHAHRAVARTGPTISPSPQPILDTLPALVFSVHGCFHRRK